MLRLSKQPCSGWEAAPTPLGKKQSLKSNQIGEDNNDKIPPSASCNYTQIQWNLGEVKTIKVVLTVRWSLS